MEKVVLKSSELRSKIDHQGFVSLGIIPEFFLTKVEALFKQFSVEWGQTGFYSSMMINDPAYRKRVTSGVGALVAECLQPFVTGYDLLFVNFLVKLPNENNYIGVHQDWDFVDENKAEALNFWFPLVDVDDSNGNLYIVEGSHKNFRQPRGTPYINYFKGHESAVEKVARPLCPKRGELVLYQGSAVHFSKPNKSGILRIAVGGVIIPTGVQPLHYRRVESGEWIKYTVDKTFFESFLPDGEINGYAGVPAQFETDYFSDTVRESVIQRFLSNSKAS